MNRFNRASWSAFVLLLVVALVGWAFAIDREHTSKRVPHALLRMHDDFVLAFIDSQGFGVARITPMMAAMQRYRTQGEPALWLADLELIGIAKHPKPVVFASPFQGFQHAEEGAMMPVRPSSRSLTLEEEAALSELRDGRPLALYTEGAGLRVVGPIRAGHECLGCHQQQSAGDMLGAFIYRLQPQSSLKTPAAR